MRQAVQGNLAEVSFGGLAATVLSKRHRECLRQGAG
jgi:hypothetical protein